MLQQKFKDLLEIMAIFLGQEGYKSSRKKGEYYKAALGKIIKIRLVLSSRMRGGKAGEIRAFIALEYPELEKLVCALKEEPYKKGNNLFMQDIGLFCGERSYRAFCFSVDSNMEYVGRAIREILVQNVFAIISVYEKDSKIIDKFECDSTSWRSTYFSGGRADMDFYLRWISLCILNGYIREAAVILNNIPGFYGLEKDIKAMKGRLKTLCTDREQTNSLYLLIHNSIKINPGKEALKKAINKLDGLHTYYMLLEAPGQGSYLQVAGGSGEYTVEIRKQTNEEHCHYRAETKSGNSGERKILYGGGELTLQTCQVLSIDQVYETACKYLVTQEPHGDYIWKELIL